MSPTTVLKELKRAPALHQVNRAVVQYLSAKHVAIELCRAEALEQRRGLPSELDEMWSSVGKKAEPRWWWHALDHHRGTLLAYVFGRRQEAVFVPRNAL